MDNSIRRKRSTLQNRRRSWCCSFAIPPSSPKNLKNRNPKKSDPFPKPVPHSFAAVSRSQSSKSGLNIVNRIDPRRILSPGRVSPMDSDTIVESIPQIVQSQSPAADITVPRSRSGLFRAPIGGFSISDLSGQDSGSGCGEAERDAELYDVRLNLKGNHGGCLVLEMSSGVLCANSGVFAGLIEEFMSKSEKSSGGLLEKERNVCRIEVPEVENLGVFRQTIDLMFEEKENITKMLLKIGVSRGIDILETWKVFHQLISQKISFQHANCMLREEAFSVFRN